MTLNKNAGKPVFSAYLMFVWHKNFVLFCSQISADAYFLSPPTALTPGSGELPRSLCYTLLTPSKTPVGTRRAAAESGRQLREASVCFAELYPGYAFLFSRVSGYPARLCPLQLK